VNAKDKADIKAAIEEAIISLFTTYCGLVEIIKEIRNDTT